MKRALLVTACWPPSTRVGARRVVRLARRLPALGWTPIVLHPVEREAYAAPRAEDRSLEAPPVEVHAVPALFPSVQAERLATRALGRTPLLRKMVSVLFRDGRLPDQFVEWAPAAVRAARQVGPVDCVWVTGAPFGIFLPGLAVARDLGVPAVLDYRDPWTPDLPRPNHPLAVPRRAKEALERWVLQQAAGVVFVNDDMERRYAERFGRRAGVPWAVIANGFDPADAPTGQPVSNPRPTLLYAGTCYGSRSMRPVLEALAEGFGPGTQGLQLRVFGALDPAARAFLSQTPLPGRVDVRPRIGSREVFAQMRGAEALLLIIGAEHRTALTAKIFDYLLAERPILGVGPPQADAGALIERCGVGGWVDTGDRAALVAALRRVERRALDWSPQPNEIKRYSADQMAEATAAMLHRIT